MSNKKNIPKAKPKKTKLPSGVLEVRNPQRDGYPVFSFLHVCENHCLLSEWQNTELDELIAAFKTMENLTWNQLPGHKGLDFTKIDRFLKPLPPNVSPDQTIYEISVCKKKRIFGYRADNIFRVLWFDREHEVVPYRKVRRK